MIHESFQRPDRVVPDSEYRLRVRFMVIAIVLGVLYGVGRYGYWLVIRGDEISTIASDQYRQVETIPAERGRIYDRNGVILACNIKYVTLGVDRESLKVPMDSVLRVFANVFHRPVAYYLDRLAKVNQRYVVLEKRRTLDETLGYDWSKLKGVVRTLESARTYPNGACAASIIGKVDNSANGIFGLERSLNKQLAGTNGKQYRVRMGNKVSAPDLDAPIIQSVDGANISTTIDIVAQQIVEQELEATMNEFKAVSGTVIVVVPQTGEILAMASYPFFDPNTPSASDTLGFRPRPVYDLFEPGSTMKTFTFAAVLENTNTRLDEVINTFGGSYWISGKEINDDHHSGPLSVSDGFAQSSNIVTLQLGLRLKPETFRSALLKFGFVQRPRSGLPAEQPGMMPSLKNWSELSQATISYGHGVSVSSLQMTMGYAALANRGMLMRPQLVKRIEWNESTIDEYPPEPWQKAVSQETAETMLMLMRKVAEVGTAKRAQIKGIPVGGKTGTARKLSDRGGYMEGHYVANFIGIAPIDDPKLVCAVVIDDPRAGSHYGGVVAAPAWARIVERLLRTLPATSTQSYPVKYVGARSNSTVVPDFTGYTVNALERATQGWEIKYCGKGNRVISQIPVPGSISNSQNITLQLGSDALSISQLIVPDLTGLHLKAAVSKLSTLKFQPAVEGGGRVIRQYPKAGVMMPAGSEIHLICEDQPL